MSKIKERRESSLTRSCTSPWPGTQVTRSSWPASERDDLSKLKNLRFAPPLRSFAAVTESVVSAAVMSRPVS